MILHYSLAILNTNDNALSLLFFANAPMSVLYVLFRALLFNFHIQIVIGRIERFNSLSFITDLNFSFFKDADISVSRKKSEPHSPSLSVDSERKMSAGILRHQGKKIQIRCIFFLSLS